MSGSRLTLFFLGFSCGDILVFIRILDSRVLYVHGFGDKEKVPSFSSLVYEGLTVF